MSTSYQWFMTAHVIGWVMWIGGLVGLATLLVWHRKLDGSTVKDMVKVEKAIAMEMDIGALIAIGFGVVMILESKNMGDAWVMKKAWMHVKLTLVLALFGAHAFIRIKIGKAGRGDMTGISPVARVAVILIFLGVVTMVVARPI
jgi:uncharacterized membrane protein